ncbi:MAG TPA: VOC family protein [Bradyrhizobium sp.]|jgi:2,3-dihydroxybiphenyl 1,2-dioxygenase|uniref:VOC family protein n=1 Tax=Bradyrhizobium sp. TaxID=376 RepID=UPI002CABFEF5|nr:VOC family protein [Bradyrhizobium sp.]HTB02106.1 VOC family protein [Bradyrhizobium sp.]
MEIQAFGYLGVGSSDLDDWAAFATSTVGMQPVDRASSMRAFRMDDRKQRLFIDRAIEPGTQVFGWEVANAAALDQLAARLEAAGVAVKREPANLADQRCVAGLISFADPAGNRLEAFHGAQIADAPFKPSRDISGFRTGPQGMGHTLLTVPDIDAALAFYKDLLGFRISDFIVAPLKAYFLHVNPRHHSVALVAAPVRSMHHLLVEYYLLDDVGQGFDLLQNAPEKIVSTIGRHSNDLMTSYYMRTPSEIYVECGWGGKDVDDATPPAEMASVASFWGHKGLFEDIGAPPSAAPEVGSRRAPVQVIEGNYNRMAGVCQWWDEARRNR